MTGRKFVFAGTALLLALGLGACGEREQVIVYKQGKYQGKPDTKPWENDPAANPLPLQSVHQSSRRWRSNLYPSDLPPDGGGC